jgi:hypothetical protein
MSDGSKVFSSVKKSLEKLFPKMSGHQASHFNTLLQMVAGLIVSKHCHLPKIAGKIPLPIKQESIIAKFKRWLSNNDVNGNIYFAPFLDRILLTLINGPIKLIIDGSVIGMDSACLMASIIYKNRSIPIAWLVGEGSKGHFTVEFHIKLLEIVKGLLPNDSKVTVIGDGGFDGVDFLETIDEYGWSFVIRTAKNSKFMQNGNEINLPEKLKPGEKRFWKEVEFTNEYYGPLMVTAWRPDKKNEILYLISNRSTVFEVIQNYNKRQKIETFFSDLKTKGFHLQKSHLENISRPGNLMIAACIAYIWIVLLGQYALNKGLNAIFHRTDRCDLSLLQLGFRYIEYLLNNNFTTPQINFLRLE